MRFTESLVRASRVAFVSLLFAAGPACGPGDDGGEEGYDEAALVDDDADDPTARSNSVTTSSGLTLTVKPADARLGKKRAKTFKVTVKNRDGTPVVGRKIVHYYACISGSSNEKPCSFSPESAVTNRNGKASFKLEIPAGEPEGLGSVVFHFENDPSEQYVSAQFSWK